MTIDATYYSDDATLYSGVQPRAGIGFVTATGSYTLPAASDLDTNDLVKMVKIPAGATIKDVYVDIPATGIDTSTGLQWSLGDQDGTPDEDRYITVSTVGRSSGGGIIRMNNPAGAGYQFAAEGTIDIKIVAGATTNVVEGTINVTVYYTFDA